MSGLSSFLAVVFVVAIALVVVCVVDWNSPPPVVQPNPVIESAPTPISPAKSKQISPAEWAELEAQTKELMAIYEWPDSLREPVVPVEVPANIREIEQNRRAHRPTEQKRKPWPFAWPYDSVVAGATRDGKPLRAKPAEAMPPTSCRSVEPAPRDGPHAVHDDAVLLFQDASGFGSSRMVYFKNQRGVYVASRVIDRVELVSLLTESEPSVYVLDEMATPALARQAKRRPLDQFEVLGLDAVRRGEHLVWTPEAPKRMFGAIRARKQCLECHVNAQRGDLLGAFTYYLEVPVDELAKHDPK